MVELKKATQLFQYNYFSIMKKQLLFIFSFILLWIVADAQVKLYKEKYRPQFHFTPAKNWMNDPNGLVYYDGEYHLFYQFNPYGNRWGHMTWAHSVSKDLVHWEALPIAIPEADKIMIFSGSAVVDEKNSSGFATKPGEVPMVAIYTGHFIADSAKPDDCMQAQYIAYSLDKGRTWTKYANNPVLDLQKKDHRDPKVFWYEPDKKWIMLTVLPQEHKVLFHSSVNLKQWTYLSEFGPAGDIKDIWECPDLLKVPVKGETGKMKWVLINSQQTTMQYFVGDFNGTAFINENPATAVYRPDHGPDYYAGITYNQLPANHAPILLGWANNWKYANDIPTYPWKSAMALPRELSLKYENNQWILLQQPVHTLQRLRNGEKAWEQITVTGNEKIPVKSQQFEMETDITVPANGKSGLKIAAGKDNYLMVGYNGKTKKLYIDRTGCRNNSFHKNFSLLTYYETDLEPLNGKVKLHLFFDKSIVEVFANDGSVVMTAQLFPEESENGIELFSEGGNAIFNRVKFRELKSAWQ